MVMSGVEDELFRQGYFCFVISHHNCAHKIAEFPALLQERSVEGIIALDTILPESCTIPAVTISGRQDLPGVTNVLLDHELAAHLTLEHLYNAGHRRIAFIKAENSCAYSERRWFALTQTARRMGIAMDATNTIELNGDVLLPLAGYEATQQLLQRNIHFTAICAFNDISTIGAIRALRGAGMRVPDDVSVIGFDDIQGSAFQNPRLTTIRLPLRQMGMIAAETLMKMVAGSGKSHPPREIIVKAGTGSGRKYVACEATGVGRRYFRWPLRQPADSLLDTPTGAALISAPIVIRFPTQETHAKHRRNCE